MFTDFSLKAKDEISGGREDCWRNICFGRKSYHSIGIRLKAMQSRMLFEAIKGEGMQITERLLLFFG
jgi:hypothetical protein